MKLFYLTLTLLLSAFCHAQTGVPVNLTMKDGLVIDTRLTGRSQTALITTKGKIRFEDLSNVSFEAHDEAYDNLIEVLKEYNVTVDYSYQPLAKSPLIQQPQADTEVIIYGLDNFRKQRAAGKAMQLVGMLAVSASVVLQQVYNKQYQDDFKAYAEKQTGGTPTGTPPTQKTVGPALPIAGGAIMFIGFAIDLGAGKHLRL